MPALKPHVVWLSAAQTELVLRAFVLELLGDTLQALFPGFPRGLRVLGVGGLALLAPLLTLGLTILALAFSFSLLSLGLALRCFLATLAPLWSSLGLNVFDSVAHVSEQSQLFSDGWWFARNLGPL